MKTLKLGWAIVFALSMSVANGATLYDPEEANSRMQKKIANPPIRMEGHKTSRMESYTKDPEVKAVSYLRSKSAMKSTTNDY